MDRTSLLLRIDEEFERSGVVVVVAPAGFGKTTLLEDVERRWHMLRGRAATVVRVDCAQRRCTAFMEACRSRRACSGARAARPGPVCGTAMVPNEPLSQLVWACIDERAPDWADYLRGQSPTTVEPPLVIVDNAPAFDGEEYRARFGDMLRRWTAVGVRFIVAAVPSRDVSAEFPDALRLSAADLRVSPGEMSLWVRDLHLPDPASVLACTAGIPAIVDACRRAAVGRPLGQDSEVCRSAARVVSGVLRERATIAVERLEVAMLLLGEGAVGELGELGVDLRPDDLAIVENEYPVFGLNLARGSFETVPTDLALSQNVFMDAVLRDANLAGACVGALVTRGDVARGISILRLLPDEVLSEVLGRNALSLVDAAVDDIVVRGLRYAAGGGACSSEALRGLTQLDALRHEARRCPLVLASPSEAADSLEEWRDVCEATQAMAQSWDSLGPAGLRSGGEEAAGDASSPAGEIRAEVAPPAASEATPAVSECPVQGREPEGLAAICARLARAAADCNAGEGRVARDLLLGRLGGMSLLSARLLCHHAALCAILAHDPPGALAWLSASSSVTLTGDSPGASPQTVTEALLMADACAARLLVERPSESDDSRQLLERLRSCCAFLERRKATSAYPWPRVLEAICCLLDGREMEGLAGAEASLAAFRRSGCLYGQLLCAVVRAYSELARRQSGQAAVSAATVRKIATSLHSRPLVDLAGLLETLALWPRRSVGSLDARLLEVALRESALRPRASKALVLERALLCCASGDADGAREALDEAASFEGAISVRMLCAVVRASGNLRSRMAELASPTVRAELAALEHRGTPRVLPDVALVTCAAAEKPLVIRMFGGMSVEMHGQPLGMEQWGRTKSRQLLGVLAMQADKPVQREQLMAALWPGRDPNTLRSSLYSALTALRGALGQKNGGPQLVESFGTVVRLNLELVEVDVLRLETLARDVLSRRETVPDAELFAACSEMERAYSSGLDPEFDNLGDEGHRRSETLASLFAEAMLYGSRRAMAADAGLSLWLARCAQRASGQREDVTLGIMRALRAMSRFGAALGEYRRFADFERESFGMQPPAALRRERDSIVSELAASGVVALPSEVEAQGASCMEHLECVEQDADAGYALYRQRG